MKKAKLFMVWLIVILVLTQFSMVSAAMSLDVAGSISGTVEEITIKSDASTGINTVWVVLVDAQGGKQTVQLSEANALELHLIVYENDVLVPNPDVLNTEIEIPLSYMITPEDGEMKHPVASALAAFFSEDISGLDYDFIMSAHEDGFGFGVIAQALWMTQKLGGDTDDLTEILKAKESGDYSYFTLVDGSIPMNWGQFRKAVMDGDKEGNLGLVMSSKDKDKGNQGKNDNGGNQGNALSNGNNKNTVKTNNGNNGNPNNNVDKGNNGNTANNGNKGKP